MLVINRTFRSGGEIWNIFCVPVCMCSTLSTWEDGVKPKSFKPGFVYLQGASYTSIPTCSPFQLPTFTPPPPPHLLLQHLPPLVAVVPQPPWNDAAPFGHSWASRRAPARRDAADGRRVPRNVAWPREALGWSDVSPWALLDHLLLSKKESGHSRSWKVQQRLSDTQVFRTRQKLTSSPGAVVTRLWKGTESSKMP